jgi:hypothetical protein
MEINPFLCGNPVSAAGFFDRRAAQRRIVGRLLAGGQSTAVLAEPRAGKTSLLRYLAAPELRATLYGTAGQRFVFSFVDTQMLQGEITAARFWEDALAPVKEQLADAHPESAIARQYEVCRANQFGNATLGDLFKAIHEAGWTLVLMLDDFHLLLQHPILNSAEFFGGLRSLGQKSTALALVIASCLPLSTMNTESQAFKPTGSPYLNFFVEHTLEPFPEQDVQALLGLAGARFDVGDHEAIRTVAGGHPFLLQAAAAAMWDAHEDGVAGATERRQYMGQRLYREHRLHFSDTWRLWSPAYRKAFTSVALAHTAHLLPAREFLTTSFIEGLRDWGPELGDLQAYGLLRPDEGVAGGWRVAPEVMLWWLADELVRAVRADASFTDWLRAEELDGVFTHKEQEQLGQVVRGAAQVLRQGAGTLVEAFAKGAAAGLLSKW